MRELLYGPAFADQDEAAEPEAGAAAIEVTDLAVESEPAAVAEAEAPEAEAAGESRPDPGTDA